MNFSGSETFNGDIRVIWDALHDTNVLKNVIPGCQSMEPNEDGKGYNVELKLGIAAVKGEYLGEVMIEDVRELEHYILHAKGSGTPGYVEMKMDCQFQSSDCGTYYELKWNCEAEVGGKIASVGNRVLSGVAQFIAKKFFKDLKKELAQLSDEGLPDLA